MNKKFNKMKIIMIQIKIIIKKFINKIRINNKINKQIEI